MTFHHRFVQLNPISCVFDLYSSILPKNKYVQINFLYFNSISKQYQLLQHHTSSAIEATDHYEFHFSFLSNTYYEKWQLLNCHNVIEWIVHVPLTSEWNFCVDLDCGCILRNIVCLSKIFLSKISHVISVIVNFCDFLDVVVVRYLIHFIIESVSGSSTYRLAWLNTSHFRE